MLRRTWGSEGALAGAGMHNGTHRGWRSRGAALLLSALLLSVVAGASQAEEDEPDYTRPGPYIGLAGIFAVEEFPGSEYDDSMGVSARVGYRTHELFALELQYEFGADFESDQAGRSDVETHVVTANMKAIAPFGMVQPFMLVGAGFMASDQGSDENQDFALRAGGGIDLHVATDMVFGVDATYVKPAGSTSDFDYISVGFGVRYRF